MSFSFRSLFQRDAGSSEPGQGASQHFTRPHQSMAGATSPSLPHMQASTSMQPSPGASPFQIGGSPLFKTAGSENIAAPPINSTMGMSPFSIAGATPTNAPLTVGDVINQLPPEVVRAGALPLEQPLSLPTSLLENALRSGQAALPVFELYRVCPALFQVPISPQDPRLVPLPASKLPGLIAQAREGQGGVSAPAAAVPSAPSPFSFGQPTPSTAASPFQMITLWHGTAGGITFCCCPCVTTGIHQRLIHAQTSGEQCSSGCYARGRTSNAVRIAFRCCNERSITTGRVGDRLHTAAAAIIRSCSAGIGYFSFRYCQIGIRRRAERLQR